MPSPKRKSPEPDHDAPFEDVATPAGSPPRKKLRITRAQKQALIDNLQLEITERARKLRAQYALQANDLRARIERRINRIPVSLRKATMGELLEKHNAAARNPTAPSTTTKRSAPSSKISKNAASASAVQRNSPTKLAQTPRKTKRISQENYSDKENAPAVGSPADVLKNPKKRGKPAVADGATDYRILSPKSLNSRTYPQSPFRTLPEKAQHSSYLSRPTSPLKPFSPFKTGGSSSVARPATAASDQRPTSPAKKTTTRAATGPKSLKSPLSRPATRQHERKISSGTVSSSASSGMTVLKPTRTGTGARKAATVTSTPGVMAKQPTVARGQAASMAVKKTSATTAAPRKATAPAAMDAPTTGRRVLRKRV